MSNKKYPSGKAFSDDSPYISSVPGLSLTYPQKYFPWDRPPTIVDIEEAKDEISKRMQDPEIHKYIVRAIDSGVKPETLGRILADAKVMDGTYNPDIALLMRDYATIHIFTIANELDMNIPAYDSSKKSTITPEDLQFVQSDIAKTRAEDQFKETLENPWPEGEILLPEVINEKPKGLMSMSTTDNESV